MLFPKTWCPSNFPLPPPKYGTECIHTYIRILFITIYLKITYYTMYDLYTEAEIRENFDLQEYNFRWCKHFGGCKIFKGLSFFYNSLKYCINARVFLKPFFFFFIYLYSFESEFIDFLGGNLYDIGCEHNNVFPWMSKILVPSLLTYTVYTSILKKRNKLILMFLFLKKY